MIQFPDLICICSILSVFQLAVDMILMLRYMTDYHASAQINKLLIF